MTEITDQMTASLGRNGKKLFLWLTDADGWREECIFDKAFDEIAAFGAIKNPKVWIYGKGDITRVVAHFTHYIQGEGKIVIWQNQEALDFAALFSHKEAIHPSVLLAEGNVEVRLLEDGTLLISASSAMTRKKYTVVVDQLALITATLIETIGETE